MQRLVGREYEVVRLNEAYESNASEFVAVYGRRRVGKTFLIRQTLKGRFAFSHTGLAKSPMIRQLAKFRESLVEAGYRDCPKLRSWGGAFRALKEFLSQNRLRRKVVFMDEMPWMDTPRSGFVSELEHFWNGWASARDDIMLVVCGSATSWIINKVIRNRGGLHNRVTMQLALQPFTLSECESFVQERGLAFSRTDIAEAYMIFGGVPYYWSLMRKNLGLAQNVDALCFAAGGELTLEFDQLYASLFSNPEPYLKIITALAVKGIGSSRDEIARAAKLANSGKLTKFLEELEQCGFIRRYTMFGKTLRDALYQLLDPFTLFHFKFMRKAGTADPRFWTSALVTPAHSVWAGLAFERLCLMHVEQIKAALGVAGVKTQVASWWHRKDANCPKGAQIDLVLDRADRVINLCEMKWSEQPYEMSARYDAELSEKRNVFVKATGTRHAIMQTLVTAQGLKRGMYASHIQFTVVLDDLFAPVRDTRI